MCSKSRTSRPSTIVGSGSTASARIRARVSGLASSRSRSSRGRAAIRPYLSADPAVPHHHCRHAVPGRWNEARLPGDLAVVVGVDVDEAGVTNAPRASISMRPEADTRPTSMILPRAMATSPSNGSRPVPSTTTPWRTTRSGWGVMRRPLARGGACVGRVVPGGKGRSGAAPRWTARAAGRPPAYGTHVEHAVISLAGPRCSGSSSPARF
jgi:hypothetical protein